MRAPPRLRNLTSVRAEDKRKRSETSQQEQKRKEKRNRKSQKKQGDSGLQSGANYPKLVGERKELDKSPCLSMAGRREWRKPEGDSASEPPRASLHTHLLLGNGHQRPGLRLCHKRGPCHKNCCPNSCCRNKKKAAVIFFVAAPFSFDLVNLRASQDTLFSFQLGSSTLRALTRCIKATCSCCLCTSPFRSQESFNLFFSTSGPTFTWLGDLSIFSTHD